MTTQIEPATKVGRAGQSGQIDPRGQQFAAALTSVVLALVLLTAPGPLSVGLLVVQAALFALAVTRGVQRTPVAAAYRRSVRPRLSPPDHLEDPEPPRFAQGVGLAFTLVGLVGFVSGATWLGFAAVALALVAALLNATVGFCLGCELYLLGRRLRGAGSAARTRAPATDATSPTTTPATEN